MADKGAATLAADIVQKTTSLTVQAAALPLPQRVGAAIPLPTTGAVAVPTPTTGQIWPRGK